MPQRCRLCRTVQRRCRIYPQIPPTAPTQTGSSVYGAGFCSGDAYQFDWSIETVCLAGQTVKVNVAHFRLCHSRAFFVCAYPNQKADMLMDAHNRAFAFFGGVPARGIYDNMKTAVTRIGKGKEREFNAQFLQMMTHFLIEPIACTPASGWEKGQVERQIRYLRERLFKPTLAFDSFISLNDYLQQQCLRLMGNTNIPNTNSRLPTYMGQGETFAGRFPALSGRTFGDTQSQ